jgi:hypothetical protein
MRNLKGATEGADEALGRRCWLLRLAKKKARGRLMPTTPSAGLETANLLITF